MEKWKKLKGYEDSYEVSDLGRIRSIDREITRTYKTGKTVKMKKQGKILNSKRYKDGQLFIMLKGEKKYIHRMVMETFDPVPNMEELFVVHNDGDYTNNELQNLSWSTKSAAIHKAKKNKEDIIKNEGNRITEEFLNQYITLEKFAQARYPQVQNTEAVKTLENDNEFFDIKQDIFLVRTARNLLIHNSHKKGDYPIEIKKRTLDVLNKIINRLSRPLLAQNICIPLKNVYSRKMDDKVRPTMVEMNKKIYTHVPILEDNRVIGAFSENSIFSYLINEEIVEVDEDLTFNSIVKYLPIEKHTAEKFQFISKNKPLFEIRKMFADALEKNIRLGMLFVTQNGRESECLYGIITPWDVAPIDKKTWK